MNYLHRFAKNSQVSNFMKTRPVRAELFHADRWTDMTQLIAAFRNFAKAPKNALAPDAIRNLDRSVHSPVTIPTTIPWLQFVTVYVIIVIIFYYYISCLRRFSPGNLEPKAIPTDQASRIMCAVPGIAVCYSESIE